MLNMREGWTDERLDDFAKHVDHRFDQVDRRFEEVDRRFDEVDRRFLEVDKRFGKIEGELHRVNDRLDGLHRVMGHGILVIAGAIVASNAAMIGLVVTQL
jgi:hypothetical protein